MKKGLFTTCIMFFMTLSYTVVSGQQTSNPLTNMDWKFVTEKHNVDVFYKAVECNGKTQIHLMVINDLPQKREINFNISFENQSNQRIFKEIILKAEMAERMKPDCSINKWNDLKIDLPKNFVIQELSVKTDFKKMSS